MWGYPPYKAVATIIGMWFPPTRLKPKNITNRCCKMVRRLYEPEHVFNETVSVIWLKIITEQFKSKITADLHHLVTDSLTVVGSKQLASLELMGYMKTQYYSRRTLIKIIKITEIHNKQLIFKLKLNFKISSYWYFTFTSRL